MFDPRTLMQDLRGLGEARPVGPRNQVLCLRLLCTLVVERNLLRWRAARTPAKETARPGREPSQVVAALPTVPLQQDRAELDGQRSRRRVFVVGTSWRMHPRQTLLKQRWLS